MTNAKKSIVRVALGERSYDVVVGSGIIGKESGGRIAGFKCRALVVTNRKVYNLFGRAFCKSLDEGGVSYKKIFLPDGEKYKTIDTVGKIHDKLVQERFDRNDLIVALGGGVVGDIAGFAAATYMRGIKVVQVATTLLSQVDSSVGGKTGVNHPGGKNLIGSFHQPSLTLLDVEALNTLPLDEILCGVAEVIKYGLIESKQFFGVLEKRISDLVDLDPKVTADVVKRCCRIKAKVVADDEKETGRRAILNFGHTVGHAIESVTRYGKYKHGYAVAIGMVVAARLSCIKGTLPEDGVQRVTAILKKAGLPYKVPTGVDHSLLIKAMEHDKKAKGRTIRFALLDGIGKCVAPVDVTKDEIREALKSSV